MKAYTLYTILQLTPHTFPSELVFTASLWLFLAASGRRGLLGLGNLEDDADSVGEPGRCRGELGLCMTPLRGEGWVNISP